MALNITYWTASRTNPNVPGGVISNESVAIGGSSAQSGATPANAMFVSIRAGGEDSRFRYDSANPTALSTDAGIGDGERLWLDAVPGFKLAAVQY